MRTGGLAGLIGADAGASNCYATGRLESTGITGGFAGENRGEIKDSFVTTIIGTMAEKAGAFVEIMPDEAGGTQLEGVQSEDWQSDGLQPGRVYSEDLQSGGLQSEGAQLDELPSHGPGDQAVAEIVPTETILVKSAGPDMAELPVKTQPAQTTPSDESGISEPVNSDSAEPSSDPMVSQTDKEEPPSSNETDTNAEPDVDTEPDTGRKPDIDTKPAVSDPGESLDLESPAEEITQSPGPAASIYEEPADQEPLAVPEEEAWVKQNRTITNCAYDAQMSGCTDLYAQPMTTGEMTGDGAAMPGGDWYTTEGAYPQLKCMALHTHEIYILRSKASAIPLILPMGIGITDIPETGRDREEEDVKISGSVEMGVPDQIDGDPIQWSNPNKVTLQGDGTAILEVD